MDTNGYVTLTPKSLSVDWYGFSTQNEVYLNRSWRNIGILLISTFEVAGPSVGLAILVYSIGQHVGTTTWSRDELQLQ